MKRLLVVLLLYTFGGRTATIWNFMGLFICTAGLLAYAWDKSKAYADPNNNGNRRTIIERKWTIMVISAVGFLVITIAFEKPAQLQLYENTTVTVDKGNNLTPFLHQINNLQVKFETFQKRNYVKYIPNFSDQFSNILKAPLHRMTNANFVSEKLSTSDGIIKESQRLHFDIIGKELENIKYVFLIQVAAFENKGDPAITAGEIYYLARMNIEIVYYCHTGSCSKRNLEKARDLSRNYNRSELAILINGGGNIVTYPEYDHVRFNVINLFPFHRKIVFPQSISIKNWNDPFLLKTIRYYCCNSNLTIVLRDALSYSIAKKLFNGTTRLIMAPDMAFQIGPVPRFMSPVFDIMWLKRKDHETPNYPPPEHVPQNLRVHISDWWKWVTPPAGSSLEKAFYITTNGFFYLQRGRVVITDRLHGHILSTLMDIPHVLIDNKAKKLSAYHNTWTRSLENTVITDDPQKALGLAIELLKKYNDTLPPVVPFLRVREDFKNVPVGVPDTSYV